MPAEVAKYSDAVDDHNAIYSGASPFGGPVAPGTRRDARGVRVLRAAIARVPPGTCRTLFGNLHARQEWELFAPVMVGDAVHTRSFIVDRYVKRGRDYVVNEVLYFNADDALIARGRTHQSFLQETKDEGIVIDKKREKQPGRKFEADVSAAIEEIPALQKQITLDMCWKFSGPRKNYHNDNEMAIKWGFPDIVVAGDDVDLLPVGDDDEPLRRRLARGRQDERQPREHRLADATVLVCRGFVREITPEGERQRAHLDVWVREGRRHEGDHRHRERDRVGGQALTAGTWVSRTCSRSACPRTTPPSAPRARRPSRCP